MTIDDEEFDGGVHSPDVSGGRARARLRATVDGLVARTDDGAQLKLAWSGMRIERGGASGRAVLCSGPGRGPNTLWSEAEGFLRAIESFGGNEVADALARLEGARVSTRRRHLLAWAGLLAAAVLLLRAAPIAFRTSLEAALHALPTSVDRRIGELALASMDPGERVIQDELVDAALDAILERLVPGKRMLGEPLELRVIEQDAVNAFALPGGFLTVHTGLLLRADGPLELAGVLAHELAHVELRHGLARIAHSLGTFAALRLLLGDTEGLLALAAEIFTTSRVNDYSREQESEADARGVRLLAAARVDPEGLARFFDRLSAEREELPGVLSWLSTHPRSAERATSVRALARGLDAPEPEPFDLDWEAVQARLAP